MESRCSLGRGKPAAAPAVTLGEDRRIPSCCCSMLGSQFCFLGEGGWGVVVVPVYKWWIWGGGWVGETLKLGGRRDALEGEETRRLYLFRTPLQAAGNTPEWRKEELPRSSRTRVNAHAHTLALSLFLSHTHTRTHKNWRAHTAILWRH